MPSQPAKVPTV
ncbi:uncharacterized protein FTOL_11788 [Fusarium torulosum]|uniref:Uncharacterized protein n=1 Tax=Fusarium torulosum TaxID=33205 RepID=A0AAE8SNB7_9HYPO|nr:uncharacterized protein FTOL_11788 [Fusarium torulosum]